MPRQCQYKQLMDRVGCFPHNQYLMGEPPIHLLEEKDDFSDSSDSSAEDTGGELPIGADTSEVWMFGLGYRHAEHLLPQHRVKVTSKIWDCVNACVARPVGKKERMDNPKANASMYKE